LYRIRTLVPYWRTSVESFAEDGGRGLGNADTPIVPGTNDWQGLSRYLDDGDDHRARWASVEYAAVPTVLDSPAASLTIFWDVVGKVGSGPGSVLAASKEASSDASSSNINGDEPP